MESIIFTGNQIARQDMRESFYKSFVEYIDRTPKTTRTYMTNLRQFAKWMQDNGITQPDTADIKAYRQELLTRCSANTTKAYLQTVKLFFKWTAANGIYPDVAANVHAPKIKVDTHRKDALTMEEVISLEDSITEHAGKRIEAAAAAQKDAAGRTQRATEQGARLKAIYLLSVTAGLRTVEISRLDCRDFKERGGAAYIMVHGKGHYEADTRKYIAAEVAQAIREYLNIRSVKPTAKSPLFVSTGNRSGGKRIATTTISTMIKRAMQEAGINSDTITAHSLRHTAGNTVMTMSHDLYATQKYMRHASPVTTEIYLHQDDEAQDADLSQKLWDFYHGGGNGSGKLDEAKNLIKSMDLEEIRQVIDLAKMRLEGKAAAI